MKRMMVRGVMAVVFGLGLCGCGTTRGQRLQIYGTALTVAGHPEYGEALQAVSRALETTGGK